MNSGATPRLGVVAPLPPQRTGVAGYALAQAETLAKTTEVVLFTGLVDGAAPSTSLTVRDVADLEGACESALIDVVIYHVGNSVENLSAVRAAATGRPGVVVLHDGTLHHLLSAVAPSDQAYAEHLRLAHGAAGEAIASARDGGSTGEVEKALFDGLSPVLRRHRLVVVHSRWLGDLVRRRVPGVEVAVVPLAAPSAVEVSDGRSVAAFRAEFGIDGDDEVVGLVGYLGRVKRPGLVLAALDRLRTAGRPVRLLVVGDDQSDGYLAEVLDRHPTMRDRVTVTGFVDPARFGAALSAIDVVVALRSPHFGESSAVLATAFAHGRPVVAQRIGSSAELPETVVSFHPPGGEEVASLAEHLTALFDDAAGRAARGAAGRDFAASGLDRTAAAAELLEAIHRSEVMSLATGTAQPRDEIGRGGPVFGVDDLRPSASASSLRRRPGWLLSVDGSVHPLDGAPYFGSTVDTSDPAVALVPHTGAGVVGYTVVRVAGAESFGPGRPPEVPDAGGVGSLDDSVDAPPGVEWIDGEYGPDGLVLLAADGRLHEPDRPQRRRRVSIDRPVGLALLERGLVVIGAGGDVVDLAGAPVDTGVGRVVGSVVATMSGVDGRGAIAVTDAGRTYTIEGSPTGFGLRHQPASPVIGGAWVPGD